MSQSLLRVEDVTVHFGGVLGLAGASLAVEPGEVVGVVGALGAGKTTLLSVAAGVRRPDSGRVLFDGADLHDLPPGEAARRGLLLVPAGGGIFPSLTVQENLHLAGPHGRAPALDGVTALYARFPVLAERPRQVAGSLSGGEQRQLALARAALSVPRALLLDEPLLGLAPHVSAAVGGLVRDLASAGTAVLIVEERPSAALRALVSRLVGMRLGRVVAADSVERAEPLDAGRVGPDREHRAIELQPVRVPLTVAEKRRLQTLAGETGETVGELLGRLAREHIDAGREVMT